MGGMVKILTEALRFQRRCSLQGGEGFGRGWPKRHNNTTISLLVWKLVCLVPLLVGAKAVLNSISIAISKDWRSILISHLGALLVVHAILNPVMSLVSHF